MGMPRDQLIAYILVRFERSLSLAHALEPQLLYGAADGYACFAIVRVDSLHPVIALSFELSHNLCPKPAMRRAIAAS
jgi:hypothetical protein